jgi:hypothetical protein
MTPACTRTDRIGPTGVSDIAEEPMKIKYSSILSVAALMFFVIGCNSKQDSSAAKPGLEEAVSTATDAYVYGYPLVTMDMTRKRLTNVIQADAAHAPHGTTAQTANLSGGR